MKRDLSKLQEAAVHAGALATSLRAAHSASCQDDLLLEMVLLDLVGEVASLQSKIARVIYTASTDAKDLR